MRPVSRPPWNARWGALKAAEATAEALGQYCSACEIPLQLNGVGWHAGTGALVTGYAWPEDWNNLLVLCPFCARAAAGHSPADWGSPLRPDRDRTFALGASAPFGYQSRPFEVAGADGGKTAVIDRVFVVPNGASAADTVRLFGLNSHNLAVGSLASDSELADLPVSGENRRRLMEGDDPRLMLRTAAWADAKEATELYRELKDPADYGPWARIQARVIAARGFWSVWATVLTAELPNPPLVAGLLGVRPVAVRASPAGHQPMAAALHAFPATRGDWLASPSDTIDRN
jgi:hypothetical protein